MCVRRLLWLLPMVLAMFTSIAAAERREDKHLAQMSKVDYVDMDIELRIVEKDEANGVPLVPGNSQKMRVLRTIRRGGIVKVWNENGEKRASIVRRSNNPTIWWVSEAQANLILHDGPAPWVLVQGSEGGGKTTVLVMWFAFRVLEHIGFDRELGLTAPTSGRLKNVQKEIKRWWPKRWFSFASVEKRYTFHAGPAVQCISAAQRSESEGSPVQGNNWVAHGGDEFQDHQEREADCIARGRSAPDMVRPDLSVVKSWYPRLLTSTFKDSPAWRDFRAAANDNAKDWHVALLLGLESPFIGAEHWERFKRGVTLREYQRRVLAMDVGPERQLYYTWSRFEVDNDNVPLPGKIPGSLRPLPLGAVDVTRRELTRFGPNVGILIGHDPGKRQHVSVFLKAYEFPGPVPRDAIGRPLPPLVRWFVVDEVTSDVYGADTPEKEAGPVTVERHIEFVVNRLRSKWKCQLKDPYTGGPSANSPTALCRIDPHTNSGDEHPGRTVYSQWRNAGIQTLAAAYNPKTQAPTPIKVEERVDLLLTLLRNTEGERRLFVLLQDNGKAAAPRLVEAFESMERDESGRAEWEPKSKLDKSHWPSATAFAVWIIEKPRVDAWRARAA